MTQHVAVISHSFKIHPYIGLNDLFYWSRAFVFLLKHHPVSVQYMGLFLNLCRKRSCELSLWMWTGRRRRFLLDLLCCWAKCGKLILIDDWLRTPAEPTISCFCPDNRRMRAQQRRVNVTDAWIRAPAESNKSPREIIKLF